MSDHQHHIYQLRATRTAMLTEGPDEREAEILARHYEYLMDLGATGKLYLAGRTTNNDETTFGLALLNSGDEAAARAIMENDPAVRSGVMTAELLPFRMAFPAGA